MSFHITYHKKKFAEFIIFHSEGEKRINCGFPKENQKK